jgi:sarcosine oxidase, subunit beta
VPRIVVAGAGATGASIAYHLAKQGAEDVVLVDRAEIASGSTARAMGGVRQQFSTAAEVRLAKESIRFFEGLGPGFFQQVGYLFLATTEDGLRTLEERQEVQEGLGVPVERLSPEEVGLLAQGVATEDVLGGVVCREDGVADPPSVARELVDRAVAAGVDVREQTAADQVDGEVVVIACGAFSAAVARGYGVELPVRPLSRQLFETTPLTGLPDTLPMVLESETGFHFRRVRDCLRVAMSDPEPRWTFEASVDESVLPDRLRRLAKRFPPAGGAGIERAWAGLYDMTPDAHPIIGFVGEGVYAACGFSGHGFMQCPAVGRAVAEELLEGASSLDLTPYRLKRFAGGAVFPEEVVL